MQTPGTMVSVVSIKTLSRTEESTRHNSSWDRSRTQSSTGGLGKILINFIVNTFKE